MLSRMLELVKGDVGGVGGAELEVNGDPVIRMPYGTPWSTTIYNLNLSNKAQYYKTGMRSLLV